MTKKETKPKKGLSILRWPNGFVNVMKMINTGPGAMIPQEIEIMLGPDIDKDDIHVTIYDIKEVKEGWDELLKEKK